MVRRTYGIGFVLSGIVHAAAFAWWGWGGGPVSSLSETVIPVSLEFVDRLPAPEEGTFVAKPSKTSPVSSKKIESCQDGGEGVDAQISATDLIAGNPKPVYPEEARLLGVQGTVIVDLKIESGLLVSCVVRQSPHDLLSQAVLFQLKRWKFPKCRVAEIMIPIEFELD